MAEMPAGDQPPKPFGIQKGNWILAALHILPHLPTGTSFEMLLGLANIYIDNRPKK
jgi:hypothetical protein